MVVFQDKQNTSGMELAFSGAFAACILHAKHKLITLVITCKVLIVNIYFVQVAESLGHTILGWRVLKTNNGNLGKSAVETEPIVAQVFLTPSSRSSIDFEQQVTYSFAFASIRPTPLFSCMLSECTRNQQACIRHDANMFSFILTSNTLWRTDVYIAEDIDDRNPCCSQLTVWGVKRFLYLLAFLQVHFPFHGWMCIHFLKGF